MADIREWTGPDEELTVEYADTFFDKSMDGPVNVWQQMFDYAAQNGFKVDVESIRFEKVYSPMLGQENELVGFRMIGRMH